MIEHCELRSATLSEKCMLIWQRWQVYYCSEQQNQLFINIKQDTENNSQSVVARFRTLPDSDRWIEPRTLSDRTAVPRDGNVISKMRLSDSNSRLSIASQALCRLSHCRAAYLLRVVLRIYVVLTAHYRYRFCIHYITTVLLIRNNVVIDAKKIARWRCTCYNCRFLAKWPQISSIQIVGSTEKQSCELY